MFKSLKDPDQHPALSKVDRLFALAINGQRFEDISREEAKRLRQPRTIECDEPCGRRNSNYRTPAASVGNIR